MAEYQPGNFEKPTEEKLELKAEAPKVPEITEAEHEASRQENLEVSRRDIEQLARSGEEVKPPEVFKEADDQIQAGRDLKELTYQRSITRTQKNLPTPDRILSKLIHQPIVDTLSQIGEKTVARPSGLLGGSAVALIGTTTLLYMSKHYGFRYNFLAFFLLFVLGFGVGLLAELLLFFFRKSRG